MVWGAKGLWPHAGPSMAGRAGDTRNCPQHPAKATPVPRSGDPLPTPRGCCPHLHRPDTPHGPWEHRQHSRDVCWGFIIALLPSIRHVSFQQGAVTRLPPAPPWGDWYGVKPSSALPGATETTSTYCNAKSSSYNHKIQIFLSRNKTKKGYLNSAQEGEGSESHE